MHFFKKDNTELSIWICESCNYLYDEGVEGCHNDYGVPHKIGVYYCPKCGNFKTITSCLCKVPQNPDENIIYRNESKICENCGTKMRHAEKTRFFIFKRRYKCPNCGEKKLIYYGNGDGIFWD